MATDIAIVGIAFKGPQDAATETGLWDVLEKRKNLMTEWPASRVNLGAFYDASREKFNMLHSRGAHFLADDVSAFDAPFFSITAKEAASMDPQHRLTLEASYRAFENAGMPLEAVKGTPTAVFAASMSDDYSRMYIKDPESIARATITASALSLLPNRVSWYFDLRGPSIHVDTACSGSMVALDLACQSIHSGDASMALVLGVNLMLGPEGSILLHNGNYLSPDGVSYGFDQRANGYARGEGIVGVVIKPLADAVRDGDMIRAVIRATASNQDGRTPVLTQPSADAQEQLIRDTYRKARLTLESTRFVEAHGTGTPVGDPTEMKAIGRVFRAHRSATEPIYVGSIKSNIGHLEGSAGLAGLVKAVMVLEKGIILPNALFETMNPDIDADFYHVAVPTECIPWPQEGLRRASVNSFGFGGANAHVILDDAYHYLETRGLKGNHCTVPSACLPNGISKHHRNVNGTNGVTHTRPDDITSRLLVWTAADEKTLRNTVQAYEKYLQTPSLNTRQRLDLDKMAFTLASRRSHLLWRTFAVVDEAAVSDYGTEAAQLLTTVPTRALTNLNLVFVFTGQGAQYASMGMSLVQYPVFRDTLKQIETVMQSLGSGWSIFDELSRAENIDRPEYSQPLCTALQIALVELLKSFDIVPSAVIGHSSGEIAAAYAIGGLSLASACKVAYWRGQGAGKLRATTSTPGAMLSANLSPSEAQDYLESLSSTRRCPAELVKQIHVACLNSPLNVTLSGPEEAIDLVLQQLEDDGIFARKVKTGIAYHTPAMEAVAAEYAERMGSLEAGDYDEFSPIPMVSSVTGQVINSPADLSQAQYWTDNLVSPVRFSEALVNLVEGHLSTSVSAVSHFVEIGPHPALKRPIQETSRQLGKGKKQFRYGHVLHKSKPASQAMLEFFGQLFCDGYPVPIAKVHHQLSHTVGQNHALPFYVDFPEYPFDHSRTYWSEPRVSRDYRLRLEAPGDSLGVRHHDWNPLEPKWRRFLSAQSTPWTKDHVVLGNTIYPGTGMLVMALEAVKQTCPEGRCLAGYFVQEAHFLNPIVVGETDDDSTETFVQLRWIQSEYEKDSVWSEVRITTQRHDRWTECFRATIQMQYGDEPVTQVDGGLETRLWADSIKSELARAHESCTMAVNSQNFYKCSRDAGIDYGKTFQLLQGIGWDGDAVAVANIDVTGAAHQSISLTHPAVLDCALQVLLTQRTKGLTVPPPAMVPSHLFNAWFAASGWQPPQASLLQVLTERTSDASDPGLEAGVKIVTGGEDNTPICAIEKIVMTPVSGERQDQAGETVMLHNVEWKPQISLMSSQELHHACSADIFTKDESAMVNYRKMLEPVLDKVTRKVLRELSDGAERERVPSHLTKHIKWMDHYVASKPADLDEDLDETSLEKMLVKLEIVYPSWNIFPAMARDLKPILLGDKDPLQIAFGTGLAEKFYADVFDNVCDSKFERLLDLVSHENPTLRVLEVGAGTGGMTRHILSALGRFEKRTGGTRFAEYKYTDISPSFFDNARDQFHEYQNRMTFQVFNLDSSARDQGFVPGTYDMIVAGCVLHATRDLKRTIRNLRPLLKPGGRLLMLEVIAPENITTNFAFGVLPGWWSSSEDYRRLSPTINENQWDTLLRQEGFSGNDLVLKDYKSSICHDFSIIVSTRCETDQAQPDTDAAPIAGRMVMLVRDAEDRQSIAFGESLRNCVPQCRAFQFIFLEQIESFELQDDDIVISLLEVSSPFLSALSEAEYQVVQSITSRVRKLLWVASASLEDNRCPEYSVMQGFLRSMRSENVDRRMISVLLDSDEHLDVGLAQINAQQVAKVLITAFMSESDSDELEYCIHNGQILTARLVEEAALNQKLRSLVSPQLREEPWAFGAPVKLAVGTSGFLDTLEFVEDDSTQTELGPFEVEIESRSWGLNFRDVFVALGRLPGEDLGVDCAGIVTRVGARCGEISSLRPGNRVCGMVDGCMRTFPRAAATSFIQIPDSLAFDEAASLLSPGGTAYYALVQVARLKKGDKILIHSASGATGQMAIWVAKMVGAEVFATVGFDDKKQLLMDEFGIPADHIFYSRNTTFARGIMRVTKGYGIDVVLNSLAGDSLRASWKCVAPNGRFIEIGKADIVGNSALPMAQFARNVSFTAVDMHYMMHSSPESAAEILTKLMDLLTTGAMQHPRPLHRYSTTDVEQAFRFLQSGKNTGRIIINVDSRDVVRKRVLERTAWRLDANASYVIVGASGGLGRAISKWMAGKGAKHLILLSRSGLTSSAAKATVAELREQGVHVAAPPCDVSSVEALSSVLNECARIMPQVKGCINSAMALNDILFSNMGYAQWDETIRSKVQSSLNLHRLLPKGLDFFVLLSSLSGIYGSIGQSNYAGGCAFQDALARYRVNQGEKAISLDLGWMRNIGIVAETAAYQQNRQTAGDMMPIDDIELLGLLDVYCDPDCAPDVAGSNRGQLLVGAVTPAACLARGVDPPTLALRPMFAGFRMVLRDGLVEGGSGEGGGAIDFAALFRSADSFEDRVGVVVLGMSTKLARAMSIAVDDVQPSRQLSDYGVDSLMGVELRNWIAKEFKANVAVFEIMGSSTITAIGNLVADKSEIGETK